MPEQPTPAAETPPSAICNGVTFWPIPAFSAVDAAFGTDRKSYFDRRDLPKVPRQYEALVKNLFYRGGELPSLAPEVDRTKAHRALSALLSSFDPPHEAKIATAAYAVWVWSTPAALVAAPRKAGT